jgi:hypothetical protein
LESKPSRVADLSLKLKHWRSQLFSNLDPNDLLPGERNFRTTIHLQVHYHWAWIRMGRASLLQLSRDRPQAPTASPLPNDEQSKMRLELSCLCVDAAKATIQLIVVLKNQNLLCRFSFTDHHAPTAALIILILDSIMQNSVDTASIIDNGIGMLRFMAHGGCRGAKSDLQTVTQFKTFAAAMRQKIYKEEVPVQAREKPEIASAAKADGYQSWVQWISEKEGRDSGASKRAQRSSRAKAFQTSAVDESFSQNTEPQPSEISNSFLDMFYSLDHAMFNQPYSGQDLGLDNSSNFHNEAYRGLEWENGRLDVPDMVQLFTGSNWNIE